MDKEFVPFLYRTTVDQPMMLVYDTDKDEIVDATPETRKNLDLLRFHVQERTLSAAIHQKTACKVAASGVSDTCVEWIKHDDVWYKVIRTKSHITDSLVFEVAQQVTDLDPAARWVQKINPQTKRIELDSGESISFAEFIVLHLLIVGMSHTHIAEKLAISPKTVDYRIARLKIALGAATTEAMMLAVSEMGLIALASLPLDPDKPARSEVELYRWISN
ncbi:MAG: LuxR C-terminal-related transcriptional regulator [Halioglobus sp.]